MPIRLSAFERLILLKSHVGPGPMVDLLQALGFKACIAALKLGLFKALEASALTAEEVAAIIEADPRGVAMLLEALTAFGYIKKKGDRYENSAMARHWLLASGTTDLTELFFQFDDMLKRWDYLDETIKKGVPPLMGWEWLDAHGGGWAHYHEGLGSPARLMMKEILAGARLPASATRLLDLGGSHGMYSILFCKHHPALHATVMDWGMAQPVAEANIAHEGLGDRVTFQEGDFLEDDLARDMDAILMFNIIRILTPEELNGFFRKAHASLAPGGVLLIMDHLGKEPRTPFVKANSDLILLELYNSTQGQTHRAEAVTRSLGDLGFAEVKTLSLMRSPGLGMIRATKG
jgi:SAM-dependent methyltransferase